MAAYSVPTDISEKEKIVGGFLTAAQLGWVLGGVGGMAIFSFAFFGLFGSASIILGALIFLPAGAVMALVKVHGLPLPRYLSLRAKHKKKSKILPNKKKSLADFEVDYKTRKKIVVDKEASF